jgi:hypothetical protein
VGLSESWQAGFPGERPNPVLSRPRPPEAVGATILPAGLTGPDGGQSVGAGRHSVCPCLAVVDGSSGRGEIVAPGATWGTGFWAGRVKIDHWANGGYKPLQAWFRPGPVRSTPGADRSNQATTRGQIDGPGERSKRRGEFFHNGLTDRGGLHIITEHRERRRAFAG